MFFFHKFICNLIWNINGRAEFLNGFMIDNSRFDKIKIVHQLFFFLGIVQSGENNASLSPSLPDIIIYCYGIWSRVFHH